MAFSASLWAGGDETIGPFNSHTNLIFRHVLTNTGNAYNPNSGTELRKVDTEVLFCLLSVWQNNSWFSILNDWNKCPTGVFTAPVSGVYHFGAHGHVTGAVLLKNTEHTSTAFERQAEGYGTSSQGAMLLLEVGDVVFLRLWHNTKIFDNRNHHTTFSGHLLFTTL